MADLPRRHRGGIPLHLHRLGARQAPPTPESRRLLDPLLQKRDLTQSLDIAKDSLPVGADSLTMKTLEVRIFS